MVDIYCRFVFSIYVIPVFSITSYSYSPWLLSRPLGLYSLSSKTSYRQISWSIEAARLGVKMIVWPRNFTGISSAALLPMCRSNFRAIEKFQTRISRLRDFTGSFGKTSFRFWNRAIRCPCARRLFHAPTRTTSSGCFMLHKQNH